MARIVLAMSGGVDSSVAAWLLRAEGHDVVGLFMRHGQSGKTDCRASGVRGCCSAADAADARHVAERLGIPFYAVDFQREFDRIVDYFVDEYAAGRTPNPCIVCNTWLKFGKLFEYARAVDAEFVATGHHARLVPCGADVALRRGLDPAKDQSYVLFGIERLLLGRIRFPVGEHTKESIRQTARREGLPVSEKPDSQEICFVPDGDHARLVRRLRPESQTAGEVVTTDGAVLGRHDGYERFTVGQRKGLGIALGEPYYVVRIEPESRRVVLGRREDWARDELVARSANWLVDLPAGPFRAAGKLRYRSRPVEATVTPLAGDRFHVRFDQPRHGVAPGQAAVCYDGDRVLGGGWIQRQEEPVG